MLQCVAQVLQSVAEHSECCKVVQSFAVCRRVLQCVAVCCSVWLYAAVCCSVLQCVTRNNEFERPCVTPCRSILQHPAASCSTLPTTHSRAQTPESVFDVFKKKTGSHSPPHVENVLCSDPVEADGNGASHWAASRLFLRRLVEVYFA